METAWYVDAEIEGTAVKIRGSHDDCPRVARLLMAAPELLDALVSLYDHTKNNHNIAGLNQAAIEAIEAAVGRAPEGDAREEDEDEARNQISHG